MPGGEITDGQPVHGLAQLAADERQKKAEGVPVALAGVPGQIAFGDDIFAQEASKPWAKGYVSGILASLRVASKTQRRLLQKLRRHRQIDLRALQIGMTEIGGEYGQQPLHIAPWRYQAVRL